MNDDLDIATTAQPKVSVIMPSYNHLRYIEKAILSVIGQHYRTLELIVIDDGSTDGSVEQLKVLQARHGFKLICQENRGVCRTLNRAIREAASGDFIALLASDDFWHEDKLKLQVEQLLLHPESEFCFSQALEFADEKSLKPIRIFPRRCARGDVLQKVFLRQHVPAGTMLFSRKLYDRLGGFDETLKEEDWDFVIRSAAETPFCAIDSPLLYYRTHGTNTMRTASGTAIFHQKAKILAKSFHLVSPWRWFAAICLHFTYDIALGRLIRHR